PRRPRRVRLRHARHPGHARAGLPAGGPHHARCRRAGTTDLRALHPLAGRGPALPLMPSAPDAPEEDDAAIPLSDDELYALSVRFAVARDTPPGSLPPDPRPRRDALEEAYDAVLRLVREVRRLRRRNDRAKGKLRGALGEGDAMAMKRAIEDVLDEVL